MKHIYPSLSNGYVVAILLGLFCIWGVASNTLAFWFTARHSQSRSHQGSLFKVLSQVIGSVNILICLSALTLAMVDAVFNTHQESWFCGFWIWTWHPLHKLAVVLLGIRTTFRTLALADSRVKLRKTYVFVVCLICFITTITVNLVLLSNGDMELFYDKQDMYCCAFKKGSRDYYKITVILLSTEIILLSVPVVSMVLCLLYLICSLLCQRQVFWNRRIERRVVVVEAMTIAVNLSLILPVLVLRGVQMYWYIEIYVNRGTVEQEIFLGGKNYCPTSFHVIALIEVFCFVLRSNIDPLISFARMKYFRNFIDRQISFMKGRMLKLILKTLLKSYSLQTRSL